MLGEAYELDRFIDNWWQPLAIPWMFRLWGRRLGPGSRHDLEARLPDDAVPGRWRLRKRLSADTDPHPGNEWVARSAIEPLEVAAEFEIPSR